MKRAAKIFTPLIALMISTPARAEWSHQSSGISIPDTIGEMKKGEVRDLSGGQENDVSVQYGAGPLAVTVYVYRASYPNPALWFERTLIPMATNVGMFKVQEPPRKLTIAGSPRENALRQSFDTTSNSDAKWPSKSTAFVLGQVNEWIIKLRISSQTLERSGVDRLMDQLLAAIKFNKPSTDPLPLVVPENCTDVIATNGVPVELKDAEKLRVEGLVEGTIIHGEARGMVSGVARQPDKWCKLKTGSPVQFVTTYREKTSGKFVSLVGDSGRSVASHALITNKQGKAALYVNDANGTRLVWLFNDFPESETATRSSLPYLIGQKQGLGSISFGPAPTKDAAQPEKKAP